MTTYKYGNVEVIGIGAVCITVAKINDSNIEARSFKLRLHPAPEGQDPVALAIAKHRDILTSW